MRPIKWDLFFVVILAYRRRLIDRQEFMRRWETMQSWENINGQILQD